MNNTLNTLISTRPYINVEFKLISFISTFKEIIGWDTETINSIALSNAEINSRYTDKFFHILKNNVSTLQNRSQARPYL